MKYKKKGIFPREGTNNWEVRLAYEDPMTGEEVITYHTVTGKNRAQALKARDELIINLEVNGYMTSVNITVREFLEGYFNYKVDSRTVEKSTISGYRVQMNWVNKYLGSELVKDLTISGINVWMAKMSADGYSPRTVTKSFQFLKQALSHAVAQDMLNKNPCEFCKPPKKVKSKINALSREDRSRMLDLAHQAQPEALAVAIEIALTTGMRRGEICALKWSDFDEDNRTLTVRRALGAGEGGYYEKEPKTDGSARVIPLTQHTYCLLCDIKDSAQWMLKRLKVPFTDAYIIGTQEENSRPYNPTRLTRDFSAFCKMNGFDCTFHDLRHTFATYLIGAGTDVRTVASYLGHANVAMTLNTYADVDPEAKQRAVGNIEEAFDDAMSVFVRTSKARREEIEEEKRMERRKQQEETAQNALSNMPASSIPFTAEELEAMLAAVKGAA